MDRPLEQELMIPEKITVVAREDDHGVAGEPELLERREQPADAVIDQRDRPVVERDRLTGLALRAREQRLRVLHGLAGIALPVEPLHVRRKIAVAGAER